MIVRLFFTICLALAASLAGAQESRYAFTLAPAERFEVGATLVERHGKGGRPLIMIPGLASGPWAWQHAVRKFMPEHTVYVLTFPGFDGRPAVPGATLEAARASLVTLIESRKLARPVLIGHSLGGTLALTVAAQRPELVGAVVTLDGLPVFPGTEELPPAQRNAIAENFKSRMTKSNPAIFAAQQQDYMRGIGVVDMDRGEELAKLSAKSDPATVGIYMAEVFAQDLRPLLPKISAPVLVLTPYFALDAELQQMTEAAKVAYYQEAMKGTPKLKVVTVAPARHFAMFDMPDLVLSAIADFIKAN